MSAPFVEAPIAWRVCVQPMNARPFDHDYRPKPRFTIFATKEEAEAEKRSQRDHLGDQAVIHIEPVFLSGPKRRREIAAAQNSLDDAGWPIHRRPPRPGVPGRNARRSRQ
jgi:hypothetical protein